MRHLDAMPAWVARQRSRLIGRRSDEKIVRWINHRPTKEQPPDRSTDAAAPSSNDNILAAQVLSALSR